MEFYGILGLISGNRILIVLFKFLLFPFALVIWILCTLIKNIVHDVKAFFEIHKELTMEIEM